MRGKRSCLSAIVVLTASTLALSACGSSGGDSGSGPIRIAMVAPLSGAYAPIGNGNVAGAKAAVKQINADGGIKGRKIELDVMNDKTDPAESRTLTQSVVNNSAYVAVIGSGFSSAALADEPITNKAKLPFVSMSASGQQVNPVQPYVWVIPPTSAVVAQKMGKALADKGLTKVALLHDNGGFPTEGVKDVKALASKVGITITNDITFSLHSTDFSAELNKLKGSDADAVWLWSVTQQAVTVTKQFKSLGLPQTLVFTHGNPTPEFLQGTCPAANGAIIASTYAQVADSDISSITLSNDVKSKDLALKVNKLLGKSADQFGYDGYTGVLFLSKAIEDGGASRAGIAKSLSDTTLVGPEGVYTYSKSNHAGIGPDSIVGEQIKACKLASLSG